MLICHKVMDRATHMFWLLLFILFVVIAAEGTVDEYAFIMILQDKWGIKPSIWGGSDSCGNWEGLTCTISPITAIILPDMNFNGRLPSDIESLYDLQILILDGCKFSGPIRLFKATFISVRFPNF